MKSEKTWACSSAVRGAGLGPRWEESLVMRWRRTEDLRRVFWVLVLVEWRGLLGDGGGLVRALGERVMEFSCKVRASYFWGLRAPVLVRVVTMMAV